MSNINNKEPRIESALAQADAQAYLYKAEIDQARIDAHALLREAEQAWYKYANLIQTDPGLERAFAFYLKLRLLSRQAIRT